MVPPRRTPPPNRPLQEDDPKDSPLFTLPASLLSMERTISTRGVSRPRTRSESPRRTRMGTTTDSRRCPIDPNGESATTAVSSNQHPL